MRVSSMRRTGVSSSAWNPTSTTSPMKKVWPPQSTDWRSSQSTQAAAMSRMGVPVRLYVAPMYGYKSLKWLQRITLDAAPRPGYWEHQGYDVNAWIGRSNGRSDEPA